MRVGEERASAPPTPRGHGDGGMLRGEAALPGPLPCRGLGAPRLQRGSLAASVPG